MKYLMMALFAVSLVAACNTPSGTSSTTPKDELDGKWTMTSYSAFMPNIPTLSTGDIVWVFDSNKKSLTITKKDLEKLRVLGKAPGTYTYAVNDGMLTIGRSKFAYTLKNGTLVLNSNTDPRISADGPVMKFVGMR